MKHKKTLYIVGIVLVILALIYGMSELRQKLWPKNDPCNLDIKTLIYENKTSKEPKATEVAEILLNQYLSAQKEIKNCKDSGLKDYKITSIGETTYYTDGFMVKVAFDFEPIFPEETIWATKETKRDGSWVRGKTINLGIRQASTTYMIVP